MSDMLPPPDDDDDEMHDEAFRAEASVLMERAEHVAEHAKTLGLYAEGPPQITSVPTPFGMKPALVQQFQIGRIAFQPRVQDPESEKFDDQFRVMEIQTQDDAFLDERQRIADALARGEDPYAVEDEDDEP